MSHWTYQPERVLLWSARERGKSILFGDDSLGDPRPARDFIPRWRAYPPGGPAWGRPAALLLSPVDVPRMSAVRERSRSPTWHSRPTAGLCRAMTASRAIRSRAVCPSRTDFFLLPPRPAWYVISDGAAICAANPANGVHFASLGLLSTGSPPAPRTVVLLTGDFSYDFRAAGRVIVGHTFNDCFQIEGATFSASRSRRTRRPCGTPTPNGVLTGFTGDPFPPFGNFWGHSGR